MTPSSKNFTAQPMVDERRIEIIKPGPAIKGPVVYLMSRDQRVDDNWALLFAQQSAINMHQPLAVAVCPMADYPGASYRQISFSLEGLRKVETRLARLNIPMFVFEGKPEARLLSWLKKIKPAALVFDFSPLRPGRQWRQLIAEKISSPVYEVDAHNIVPCRIASPKREYAAYTLRPKINRLLPDFLTEIPSIKKHPFPFTLEKTDNDWRKIEASFKTGGKIEPLRIFHPGEDRARAIFEKFLSQRLPIYNDSRNNPNEAAQSDLSPYLHFGQISAQRIALETQNHDQDIKSQEAFLEQLIVRRELSDNFCFYNDQYDSVAGFPEWARKTLDNHRGDPRPYLYHLEQLESSATHDDLWNAAQTEMIITGKMHGYLRMYWAKKILEWSVSPEEALSAAIDLNDKYELDGRDPNGYAGIAWSIGGVHDRPWFEREIFGQIRYMSYGGCKSKFNIKTYVESIARLRKQVGS